MGNQFHGYGHSECAKKGAKHTTQICNWEGAIKVDGPGFMVTKRIWKPKTVVEEGDEDEFPPECKMGWTKMEVDGVNLCFKPLPGIPDIVRWTPVQCGPTTGPFVSAAMRTLACLETFVGGDNFHALGKEATAEQIGKDATKEGREKYFKAGKIMASYGNLMEHISECIGFYWFVAEGVNYLANKKETCANDWKCNQFDPALETRANERRDNGEGFTGIKGGYGLRKYMCPPEREHEAPWKYVRVLTEQKINPYEKKWGRPLAEVWTPEKTGGHRGDLRPSEMNYDNGICRSRQCTEQAIFTGGQGFNQKTLGSFNKGSGLESCINAALQEWGKGSFLDSLKVKTFSLAANCPRRG